MFGLLAEFSSGGQQGTAGLADDQYLGFVGIPKPPVSICRSDIGVRVGRFIVWKQRVVVGFT